MKSFEFHNPTRLLFGWNALEEQGHRVAEVGKKPLIVTGKGSVQKFGYLQTLEKILQKQGMDYKIFSGVEPNPRSTTVDAGARLAQEAGCDFVVALGGGSAMDAAKGMAISAFTGRSVWDHVYDGGEQPAKVPGALPVVTIPTIAATGSEFDFISVITNWERHVKNSIYSPHIYPKLSIVDPSLTTTVPSHVMGEGGVDIICHHLEPYFNSTEPGYLLQRGLAESCVRAVVDNLGTALENREDRDSRMNISWASSLALSKFIVSGMGGGYWMHAMEHVISAHYDIAHGRGLAAVLPAYMKYLSQEHPEPFLLLARNVFDVAGSDRDAVIEEGHERLLRWLEDVGMKTQLSDFGVDDSKIHRMAGEVLSFKAGGKDHLPGFSSLHLEGLKTILRDCL